LSELKNSLAVRAEQVVSHEVRYHHGLFSLHHVSAREYNNVS